MALKQRHKETGKWPISLHKSVLVLSHSLEEGTTGDWWCWAHIMCLGPFITPPKKFKNGVFSRKVHQIFFVNTPQEEFESGVFNLKTHEIYFVHTPPEEFENVGFILKTHQIYFVHTTLEEFENVGFTLKTHQIFFVRTTPEEFKKASFSAQLKFWLTKTRPGKSSCVIVFENRFS